MELDLEILWHTDKTIELDTVGMSFDIDETETRTVTFYHIEMIKPNYWDDNHEFCDIYSGGDKWISPYTYEQVKEMIKNAKTNE